MSRRSPLTIVLVIAVLAGAAAGAYGLWVMFLRPAGPPPVSVSSPAPTTAAAPAGASTAPGSSQPAASLGGLNGTWNVDVLVQEVDAVGPESQPTIAAASRSVDQRYDNI